MPHNPHLSTPVMKFGAPLEQAALAVILLHGRTQAPADMSTMIVERLELDSVAYVAPEADGNTWYPKSFLAPREENEPRLSFALEGLMAISNGLLRAGVPRSSQVVMGFSQGACLGCELILHGPRGFGALIAFTGGLLGPADTSWSIGAGELDSLPVFIGGSDRDPFVPVFRMSETAALLRRGGAHVVESYAASDQHQITEQHLGLGRSILLDLHGGAIARESHPPARGAVAGVR